MRLIALENIVVALLAGAPDSQSMLVREMAGYISPRPGMTSHRLTVEAARNMIALAERAARYKALEHEEGPRSRKSSHRPAAGDGSDDDAPAKREQRQHRHRLI